MDYTNKALGLRVQTQIPLNVKKYKESEESLKDLGINNNLAFIYEQGLIVYCIQEGTRWEWKENVASEEGLLDSDFIYPDNHVAFGIDYSNKRYNFFPYNQPTFTVPDATTTIKGILKLANDLGGTADAPTTPTAVHKTGTEIITGTKIISSTVGTPCNLQLTNSSSVNPLLITQGGNSTATIAIVNNSTLSHGYFIDCGTVSTGFPLIIKNDSVTSFTINKLGEATGTKFIKSGGTAQQFLMADGNVSELNPQKTITTSYTLTDIDNNYTIFVNNVATPVTISLGAITLPNFCVGFVQEGTGDVTFVGSGVSLTNPVGLKSKGQGYQTFIERKLATSSFFLLGNTKV